MEDYSNERLFVRSFRLFFFYCCRGALWLWIQIVNWSEVKVFKTKRWWSTATMTIHSVFRSDKGTSWILLHICGLNCSNSAAISSKSTRRPKHTYMQNSVEKHHIEWCAAVKLVNAAYIYTDGRSMWCTEQQTYKHSHAHTQAHVVLTIVRSMEHLPLGFNVQSPSTHLLLFVLFFCSVSNSSFVNFLSVYRNPFASITLSFSVQCSIRC